MDMGCGRPLWLLFDDSGRGAGGEGGSGSGRFRWKDWKGDSSDAEEGAEDADRGGTEDAGEGGLGHRADRGGGALGRQAEAVHAGGGALWFYRSAHFLLQPQHRLELRCPTAAGQLSTPSLPLQADVSHSRLDPGSFRYLLPLQSAAYLRHRLRPGHAPERQAGHSRPLLRQGERQSLRKGVPRPGEPAVPRRELLLLHPQGTALHLQSAAPPAGSLQRFDRPGTGEHRNQSAGRNFALSLRGDAGWGQGRGHRLCRRHVELGQSRRRGDSPPGRPARVVLRDVAQLGDRSFLRGDRLPPLHLYGCPVLAAAREI